MYIYPVIGFLGVFTFGGNFLFLPFGHPPVAFFLGWIECKETIVIVKLIVMFFSSIFFKILLDG